MGSSSPETTPSLGLEDDPEQITNNRSDLINVPPPQEGSVYPNYDALRFAITAWSLRDGFLFRTHKKDSMRAIYICRHHDKGCEWRVRANVGKDMEVQVSVVKPEHTCPDRHLRTAPRQKFAKRGVQYTQRWVKDVACRHMAINRETKPEDIVKVIKEHYGEEISSKLAEKSKMSILVTRGEAPPPKPSRPGRPGRPPKSSLRQSQQGHDPASGMFGTIPPRRSADGALHDQQQHPTFTFPTSIDRPDIALGDRMEDTPRTLSTMSIDPRLNAHSASMPQGSLAELNNTMFYHTHAAPPTTSLPPAPSQPGVVPTAQYETKQCQHCSGTGRIQVPVSSTQNQQQQQQSTAHMDPRANHVQSQRPVVTSEAMSTAGPQTGSAEDDEELRLLHQQVSLMARQISAMQKRKAARNR